MSVKEFTIKHRYRCCCESEIALPRNRTVNDIKSWDIRHHTFKCVFNDGQEYEEELFSIVDDGIDWSAPDNFEAINDNCQDDAIVDFNTKRNPNGHIQALMLTGNEITSLREFLDEGINQISASDCEASKHLDFAKTYSAILKTMEPENG